MEIPTFGCMTPRDYQWEAAENIKQFIRDQFAAYKAGEKVKNGYLNASVSSGKSLIMGIIANHCAKVGARCMILTDIGELADQNGAELWDMETPCSFYSAYVGQKSTYYSNVSATLGTVANALSKTFSVKEKIPHVLLIDECQKVPIEDIANDGVSQYAQVIKHFKKLNPMMVVIGFTGTPYRGIREIKGKFWSEEIPPKIDRDFLKDNGFTMPDKFGFTGNNYDFSKFQDFSENNTTDYTKKTLEEMQKAVDSSTTQSIMKDVSRIAAERNGVLVTCAGHKHCVEAAQALENESWAIVTTHGAESNTGHETRKEIVEAVKSGEIKYLFNIGIFTTGFNAPIIDTIVIMRRIGSLTLLEQLLGRGRRLLKPHQADAGIKKTENLVLDFSGTLEAMFEIYSNPVLESAMEEKDRSDGSMITCVECGEMIGIHSRKCKHCGHWIKYRECDDLKINGILIEKGCGHKNDIAARVCSNCDKYLIDPNASLSRKAYTDSDWKPVQKMEIALTGRNQDAIQVKYYFDHFGLDGKQEIATVNYWAIKTGGKQIFKSKFVFTHCIKQMTGRALAMDAKQIVASKEMFNQPKEATHRIDDKGESIVNVRF